MSLSENQTQLLRVVLLAGVVAAAGCTPTQSAESPTQASINTTTHTTIDASSRAESKEVEETSPPAEEEFGQPNPDLADFLDQTDSRSVVVRLDNTVYALKETNASEQAIGENTWVWSDGSFLYRTSTVDGQSYQSSAALLSGEVVCDTDLPLDHATAKPTGGYVMAVTEPFSDSERNRRDGTDYAVPFFAVDCETGESQPIDSTVFYGSDSEFGLIVTVGNREFHGAGDAEGNVDFVNEDGLSLNGDDYAGYHTFSDDGSLVAYGDMQALASPHFTNLVKVRDTMTGELLWETKLDLPFVELWVLDDRIVAVVASAESLANGEAKPEAVVMLDRSDGSILSTIEVNFSLLYLGD